MLKMGVCIIIELIKLESIVFMYQSNHAKAWSACSLVFIIRIQPGVEHEKWFVAIQYAA